MIIEIIKLNSIKYLKFRVIIYCLTPEICTLIQKVLNKFDYDYKYVNIQNELLHKMENEIFCECENSADIVVLDEELDKDFKIRLIKRFENIDFICLPSLDENEIYDDLDNVNQISQPFKLSEFEGVLLRITNKLEMGVKK
jgi:hypothetical protein